LVLDQVGTTKLRGDKRDGHGHERENAVPGSS